VRRLAAPAARTGRSRAIVINDGSPEPAIRAYLAELAAEQRAGLVVLENPANLGFIRTVNSGFAMLEPGEDALLVNADTVLPPGALARLAERCHAGPGIASVTPMSNNATILSFPSMPEPNPPALGLDVDALDAAFASEGSDPVEIPTGIGFCMYMNGRALAEVGAFSTDWGRGYCEEVDWCLTARDLGWVHLAATDVFVLHEGSVSFGTAARSEILAVNHARLEEMYPEYVTEVHRFIAADPLGSVRCRAMARLLGTRFRRLTLHLTHGLGGGTKRYIDDLCALERAPDHEVGIISPAQDLTGTKRLRLAFDVAGAAFDIAPDHLEDTLQVLEAAGLEIMMHVDSRLEHPTSVLDPIASGRWPYVIMPARLSMVLPKGPPDRRARILLRRAAARDLPALCTA
jgi:GT2 family glycosyltransferase